MARILVVDDEDQFRVLLRKLLIREGYEVDEAADGNIALEKYREEPFDLVIMDLIMPNKQGLETIQELKKEFENAKIIAISGGGRIGPEDYLKYAKGFGALHTLTKPIENAELLRAIRGVLSE
jgi:CheY-like chemotaxis protein